MCASGSARARPVILLPCSWLREQNQMESRRHEDTKTSLREQLDAVMAKRILVLDGAMGTMIQREKLTEETFRGERFRNHGTDLKGDMDVLVLTCPDIISRIHHQYLEAGSD